MRTLNKTKTFNINRLAAIILSSSLASTAVAMDVSPYKVGETLTPEQASELLKRYKDRLVQPWTVPDKADIDKEPNAESIRYGIQVLSQTNDTIGPKVANPNLRYSGNSLNCTNCHISGPQGLPGTMPYGIPFVNVMNDYPNFRKRSMSIGSPQDRVEGCMTRSQGAGKPLPKDSKEMKGIIDYFTWLAKGTHPNQAMQYTGLPNIDFPSRAADPKTGKNLYAEHCIACHQADGLGLKAATYDKDGNYTFPPLTGPDSFNNGAGMSRLMTATKFIHANMPLGATYKSPVLSVEEAYDIAGYIESLPRSEHPGRDKDFPNPKFRPKDYPVPAYFNGDKAAFEKAKYGPFTNGK